MILKPLGARGDESVCELGVDSQRLTRIKANDESSVYRCLGYVHGRDRAWQMDHLRRTSQGRTAELYGADAIKMDFLMRILNFSDRSHKIWMNLNDRSRLLLTAYSQGVNQGFSVTKNSEFKRLSYKPEPWLPENSVAILMLQSFDQTRESFEADLREQKRGKINPQSGFPWNTSILKSGEFEKLKVQSAGPPSAKARYFSASLGAEEGPETGSNNWVIAASRSISGKAWLANDPHLRLSRPPMWYPVGIDGGGIHAKGVTLPGAPVVAAGTNQNVAWGLTNAYLDVADIAAVDPSQLTDASTHRPLIWFRWGPLQLPFFFRSFELTKQGWPVLPIEDPSKKKLVLRWSGFDLEGQSLNALFDLILAKNISEMDYYLASLSLTGWNFVFADTQGRIGYRAIGKVPRRIKPSSLGYLERTIGELEAWDYLKPQEMPHVMAPPRGFVATANNRQWPEDSRLSGGRAYANAMRAFRIEELIQAKPKHDLGSLMGIQCDVQSVDARFLVPLILPRIQSPELRKVKHLLTQWDFTSGVDCRICGVFNRALEQLKEVWSTNEAGVYLELKQAPAEDSLVNDHVNQSLLSALKDAELKPWGDIHVAHFHHFSGRALSEDISVSTAGNKNSVNVATAIWRDGRYDHLDGASMRMMVEMTQPPQFHFTLGDPDFVEDWRQCRLLPESRNFPNETEKLSLRFE